jgi:hypothetical protein
MTTFTLDKNNARPVAERVWREIQRVVALGKRVSVKVDEAKSRRSIEQNDRLHAICHEISQQRVWAGKHIDTDGWKRLLVDCFCRETGKAQGQIVPSLDGQSVVNLGVQTRRMSVSEMSELIEWAQAWAIDNGVELHA